MRSTKEITYRGLFMIFALLVSILLHAALELPALYLVTSDFEQFGGSWWWQNWEIVHRTVNLFLWLTALTLGYTLGKHFWHVLYEK